MISSSCTYDRVTDKSKLAFWRVLAKIYIAFDKFQNGLVLRQQVAFDLNRLDELRRTVIAGETGHRHVRSRQQLGDPFVLAEQQQGRDGRKELIALPDREH